MTNTGRKLRKRHHFQTYLNSDSLEGAWRKEVSWGGAERQVKVFFSFTLCWPHLGCFSKEAGKDCGFLIGSCKYRVSIQLCAAPANRCTGDGCGRYSSVLMSRGLGGAELRYAAFVVQSREKKTKQKKTVEAARNPRCSQEAFGRMRCVGVCNTRQRFLLHLAFDCF